MYIYVYIYIYIYIHIHIYIYMYKHTVLKPKGHRGVREKVHVRGCD